MINCVYQVCYWQQMEINVYWMQGELYWNTQYNMQDQYIPHRWIMLFTLADWLVPKKLAWKVLLTSKQPKKQNLGSTTFMIMIIFWHINRNKLFLLVSMWYILQQLFTIVLVKSADIYLGAKYPPLFTYTFVNNYWVNE